MFISGDKVEFVDSTNTDHYIVVEATDFNCIIRNITRKENDLLRVKHSAIQKVVEVYEGPVVVHEVIEEVDIAPYMYDEPIESNLPAQPLED